MLGSLFYLTIGTILLYYGAEWIVKSSVSLAEKFRLSPLVVGLTVVAFGTSLPELVVSLKAAISGSSTIAIGNVIGSNVANVGLVLGLSSLIFPVTIHFERSRRDLFIYLGVTVIFIYFIMNGLISRGEGVILFVGIVAYTWMCISHPSGRVESVESTTSSMKIVLAIFFLGCIALYFGSNYFVEGAIGIATKLGVSKAVIGMSVVAFGTSLPELATSVIAAFRKESAISVGNIVGSNLFNILSVLGIVAIIHPLDSPTNILNLEIPFMVGYGLVLIPLGLMKQPISRISSIGLITGYVLFILLLFH